MNKPKVTVKEFLDSKNLGGYFNDWKDHLEGIINEYLEVSQLEVYMFEQLLPRHGTMIEINTGDKLYSSIVNKDDGNIYVDSQNIKDLLYKITVVPEPQWTWKYI